MRKTFLFHATVATAAAFALFSCAKPADTAASYDTPQGINSTDVLFSIQKANRDYVTEGNDAMFDDSLHIYSTVSTEIQWPVKIGNHDISVLQDSLKTLALGTTKGTIDQAIESYLSNPVGHDLYTMKAVDSLDVDSKAMILYQKIQANAVVFNDRYIVYGVTRSVYEGGAHGMTATSYLTWLLDKAKTLSLSNAFKPGYEASLLDTIKSQLCASKNIAKLDQLKDFGYFPDSIYISPNFYIDGYDIVFHYNPYDIGAYSTGSTDIHIPYYTIADILSPELLQIFEAEGN